MPTNPETNTPFGGFQTEQLALVRIPESFFTELLPRIQSLPQLRLLLYLFWHHEQQDREVRLFKLSELQSDPTLIQMVQNEEGLRKALVGLEKKGVILKATPQTSDKPYYFINSPQGRAAVNAIQQGTWQDSGDGQILIQLTRERPNIFKLYEKNIGAITPIMAEILKEDEQTYPIDWIEEAIRIALTHNVRNWKYIQAILDRWQKEGRGDEQNRRDHSQDPQSYRESWLRKE